MNTKNIFIFTSALTVLGCTATHEKRPNILVIFVDDMGYSDISCYGQQKWQTPNIDKLANEGVLFTDAYAASSLSSPSRAGLLTGRYPTRMGINGVFFPDSFTGIPQDELLISELLQSSGYKTGIIGKWHLGSRDRYLPLQNGFDEYFGIPYSNDMSATVYIRGNEVEEFHVDQTQMTKKYTEEAVSFIRNHKENPFFLYFAHNMPHVPIYCSDEFKGKSKAGLYGDAILEIDWSVGQIVDELEKQGILENTIIIFSSDNGPWLQEGPFGGEAEPFREGKATSFEGGVRVPLIMYWKDKFPATVNHDVVSLLDCFPTIAHFSGATIPSEIRIDGFNISKLLDGTGKRENNTIAYFSDNQHVTGLRVGDWKITLPGKEIKGNFWRASTVAHDTLLFNLKEDPSETTNLFKHNKKKAKEMTIALEDYIASFGEIGTPLVRRGNNQQEHLKEQRENAIKEAIENGIESKASIKNDFKTIE